MSNECLKMSKEEPAFPIACDLNLTPTFFQGLTKREWLAGMAINSIVNSLISSKKKMGPDEIAAACFQLADSIIEAGKK